MSATKLARRAGRPTVVVFLDDVDVNGVNTASVLRVSPTATCESGAILLHRRVCVLAVLLQVVLVCNTTHDDLRVRETTLSRFVVNSYRTTLYIY